MKRLATLVARWEVLGLIVGLTLLMGGIARSYWQQPETTAAMRGERVAWAYGCFACHGPGGVAGTADPTSPAGRVPDWTGGTAAMYVHDEDEIREWILYGAPRTSPPDPTAAERLIPMPAYEGLLTDQELDDLVAYFVAVAGRDVDMPDAAYEGKAIATQLGCFGCHGASGMGGVPNPGGFKESIAPWTGDDFVELARNDEELRGWILDGRIPRLWNNPAALYFLERQTIQMPAYRDHLSDADLDRLLAYFRWLRST